ncbi:MULTISPECIES: hypothetical protein [Halomonas]|uniref:hypothetical protein n=1 Tax=Halomonas TaxID=2745 RepID=UPI001C93B1F9|nr:MULTISPECIES: hypothetical protein [Halomonas]MBY6207464.1 hypothetical protein [Halomonas sp. DP3Y7-2]MBY6228273.1 hypothetical protein [Halomonas sp. DP3Y7-1]MCA0916338.1 hypothetical protein [Halomonas denitrificans]
MSDKSPRGERSRRALADTAVAMRWAGNELTGHAWQVVERVFEHQGLSSAQERDARIDELFADMESGGFRPSEAVEPIALSQGKVALKEQRERHADLALRQAVAVRYEYQRGLSPLTAPGMGAFDSSLQHAFQRMQSSLLEAQRHLAALDILKNLEGKHYSQRARKGGHTRARPASEQDQQALLAVMIKGMLYNDPGAIKRAQHNAEAVAHEWAVRIYELNRDFHILDIITRDKLEAEILTLLLKRLKAGQDVRDRHIHRRVMARQLRQRRDAFRSDGAARMEAELVHERGFREGVQGVLVYLLEDRFGELPDEAVEAIRATHHVDDLQACLDWLPEAVSWQAVLQARETVT